MGVGREGKLEMARYLFESTKTGDFKLNKQYRLFLLQGIAVAVQRGNAALMIDDVLFRCQ